jgi:hypothetical protein
MLWTSSHSQDPNNWSRLKQKPKLFQFKVPHRKISNHFLLFFIVNIIQNPFSENNNQHLGLTELPRKFQLDNSSMQLSTTKSRFLVECNSVSVILCSGGVTIRDELKRSLLDALCVVRNLIKLPVSFLDSLSVVVLEIEIAYL